MPKVSLIVLTYNHLPLVTARYAELAVQYARRPDVEMIVFDNGSEDDGIARLAREWQAYQHKQAWSFRFVRHTPNVGFGPGFNMAVAASQGETIYLISNDVRIFGDFVGQAEPVFQTFPNALVAKEIIRQPAGWNEFGATLVHYPAGYILATRRQTWDGLGGFDEDFVPAAFEDVDLGYRFSKAYGQNMLFAVPMPVSHEHPGTTVPYTPERYEHSVAMKALFASKHGLANTPARPG